MLKNSTLLFVSLLFLQACQTTSNSKYSSVVTSNTSYKRVEGVTSSPPIPPVKANIIEEKRKAEKAQIEGEIEEHISLGQSLRYLIPAKCEGPYLAKGGEKIRLYTQLKRQSERFLRASGDLSVKRLSCDIERMWLRFEVEMNGDFALGNLGRRVATDKASFLFPYALAVVSAKDEIVAQYANVLSAEFPPGQDSVIVRAKVEEELLLSDLGLHGPYTIYAAFVQPTNREYFNDSDHPAVWMLARKPR
tara:strand:- start:592 stop:1335 length:744 start_codon:yes stop_codon:yes gene_type:complete